MLAEGFNEVIRDTIAELPDWVRSALQQVDIIVQDAPGVEASEALGDAPAEELLGLYLGTPLPERSFETTGELSDVIFIYREPHLALALPDASLKREVAKTLLHEVAHHFGFDDDELTAAGWG